MEKIKCKRCGDEIKKNSLFCHKCKKLNFKSDGMFVIIATGVIVILLVISSFDNNKNSSYNDYNSANFGHMSETDIKKS